LYHYSGASEAVGGDHLLYGDNKNINLEKLLAKWRPLESDEAIFLGAVKARRWAQGRRLVEKAAATLNQGHFQEALDYIRQAVKTAPDLPEALTGYAQLLASRGKHRQAVEQLLKVIQTSPAHWDARLYLVDEWLAAGEVEKATTELDSLAEAFPDHPLIKERQARLAKSAMKVSDKQPSLPQQSAETTYAVREENQAVQTLRLLLEADDLPTALEQYADRLDEALLHLVHRNAASARADGNTALAEGLDALAEYIAQML